KNNNEISLIPVFNIPEVKPGDNIGKIIASALSSNGLDLKSKDIVVIAQKIVSKAENRLVNLKDIKPSQYAKTLSKEISKDPRLVEVILSETKKIIKMDERVSGKGRLIVETRGGLISANAGVDASNVSGGNMVTLLPIDSDKSAKLIRNEIRKKFKKNIAVIISDTVGRPWRNGLVDIAIGSSGLKALTDLRGQRDSKGLKLTATEMATADQIACAGGILMEKAESIPVVIVRGCKYINSEKGSKDLIRDPSEDLFR
ncbi:MAG: coenzyme F420-0:L-glutamate ligase, partial [Candidatus Dadabacteria bacterium]|nr:coenzyme F420-0:L-glutamate ligase [Candidatus Dadabacteria bacterium]